MRRAAILNLLALVVAIGGASADAAPKQRFKLDAKKIQDLGTRWMKARPKTHFDSWDRETRARLLAEARAFGPIPEGSRETVVDILWKAVRRHGPRAKKDEIETPYGRAFWIRSGATGRKAGLVLGLHGGGPNAGSAGSATSWKVPGLAHMGMYPQGIRLIDDTWNSVHGERFLLTMIEIAKAQHGIDPDRVYVMGFSMGGVGSMFMAGRHPDLLAGAIPAHGVIAAQGGSKIPLEKDVGDLEHGLLPNLRNVAVFFYTGTLDRNCEPGTFCKAWTSIKGLRASDLGGYADIRFECHEGVAHSNPPGQPGRAYKFIREKRRNAHPKKIVWEYNEDPWIQPDQEDDGKATRRPKRWMYWLHCKDPRDRMLVTAVRSSEGGAHVIDLTVPKVCFPDDFTIYLNERMYDVKQEVVARVNGKQVWRGRPQPDLLTVLESLDAKLDRTLVFDRKIAIPELD